MMERRILLKTKKKKFAIEKYKKRKSTIMSRIMNKLRTGGIFSHSVVEV